MAKYRYKKGEEKKENPEEREIIATITHTYEQRLTIREKREEIRMVRQEIQEARDRLEKLQTELAEMLDALGIEP